MTSAYVQTTGEILKEFNVALDAGLSSIAVIHTQAAAIQSEPSYSGHAQEPLEHPCRADQVLSSRVFL
jgi:hypothetical protein